MEKRENEKPEEPWVLPVRPVAVPADIAAALAKQPAIALTKADGPWPQSREERDCFIAQFAEPRSLPGIMTGHGADG